MYFVIGYRTEKQIQNISDAFYGLDWGPQSFCCQKRGQSWKTDLEDSLRSVCLAVLELYGSDGTSELVLLRQVISAIVRSMQVATTLGGPK